MMMMMQPKSLFLVALAFFLATVPATVEAGGKKDMGNKEMEAPPKKKKPMMIMGTMAPTYSEVPMKKIILDHKWF